jgi:hypothetical protein
VVGGVVPGVRQVGATVRIISLIEFRGILRRYRFGWDGVAMPRGCSPDFIPVHYHGDFEMLANHVGQMMATYPVSGHNIIRFPRTRLTHTGSRT